VLEQFGEAELTQAVLQVETLTTGADVRDSEIWLSAQNSVWNFFSRFIQVVAFEGTPVNSGLLEAVTFLQSESWRVLDWEKAPRGFVPRSWKSLVYDKSTGLNAKTYVLCVAQQLYLALKARAVYAPLSLRHRNPRAGLLEGEAWEAKRVEVARDLNMPLEARPELERLEAALDSQYLQTLSTLSTNTVLKMEKTASGLQPILTPLEALDIPPSLRHLQTEVTRRMPKIDLSELVLEVNAYTGFAREFIVLNDSKNAPTEDPDLELSENAQNRSFGTGARGQRLHGLCQRIHCAQRQQERAHRRPGPRAVRMCCFDSSSLQYLAGFGGKARRSCPDAETPDARPAKLHPQ